MPATFSEGFDDLVLPGWALQNNSSPLGTTGWFQGDTSVFYAHSGAANAYIAANSPTPPAAPALSAIG